MSEVYSIEPKTSGKVIIYTSLGELEVLLFSNECPIACKNFIQLCLNNYYNKNKFFRIIPKFLIQTGDHTNTGLHNEYAFKEPFKNEYNSRLKFLYTGCLSFANLNIDKPSNGSQFFITLDKVEYLNNKSTLFGKVAKHSIYNLLKFNNIKTNKNDEPIEDIPYIEYIKIIENPFHHLVPYTNYEDNLKDDKPNTKSESLKKKEKKQLKCNLLSFNYNISEKDEGSENEEINLEEKSEEEKSEEEKSEEEKSEEEKNEEEKSEGEKNEEEKSEEEKSEEEKNEEEKNEEEKSEEEKSEEEKNEEEKSEGEKNEAKKSIRNISESEVKTHKDSKPNESNKHSDNFKKEINKKDEESKTEKMNILKKRTKSIEESFTKENKNPKRIKELADLDETYLKNIKKYKKMSKKEREKLSLKKLEEFDNRLKSLFLDSEKNDKSIKCDWLNTNGLKFYVDSSNAYEYEDIKKNVVDSLENEKKSTYNSEFNMKKYIKQKNENKEHFK
ncbi:peptidyl-prolyl cis-trans isomerase, putative [Plasmodium gallinaceum]|uniref:Peptidyl-prolyl cis-trans isomerase, putative n=1 Tax=Plasmodium gallinaceum TaxID=5849 RepID=A0A1J1GTX3_PLAGA|nr:peptidyl-prolyl cis-trans isomerase, putative [Plasmodium gallinaceum]CRG95745.1 peptidyl-prolyl cis-trans isomerase, putative [Plasmodium gallinaceum]